MLPLGFSAGLPLLLVYGTLSYRLREAGVDRATIGFASWVALAYALKWIWAPLVDRLPIPVLTNRLGRRRAWLLLAQCGVIAGLIGMALADPARELEHTVAFALLTAFSSATQDIALDAFRIESAASGLQAALVAAYQTGYRFAMMWAGAGALWIAARSSGGASAYQAQAWTLSYLTMAASMLIGVAAVLSAREASSNGEAQPTMRWQKRLRSAVLEPFIDFFTRYGWNAVLILALVSCYRISDILLSVMASPFYVDTGFTKDEVANVSGLYGIAMTLVGAFAGASLVARFGVRRILPAAAAASSASMLLFAWLAMRGHDLSMLVAAVTADNFAGGVAGTTFIAYLSGLTSTRFTATQYALLSSLMVLVPKLLAGGSGMLVNAIGYPHFFVGAALVGVPVVTLAVLVARIGEAPAGAASADHLVSNR
ncbi:MAG TPA: AmpG family muropeptide MFS transporter [Burkholderiaceae bacterium]|nr:AmpG family muropeptide MFS transporter [Burkholderiaceae bacterium]